MTVWGMKAIGITGTCGPKSFTSRSTPMIWKVHVLERLTFYRHCLGGELSTHGIVSTEKVESHSVIDHRDLPGRGHITLCKPAPVSSCSPRT